MHWTLTLIITVVALALLHLQGCSDAGLDASVLEDDTRLDAGDAAALKSLIGDLGVAPDRIEWLTGDADSEQAPAVHIRNRRVVQINWAGLHSLKPLHALTALERLNLRDSRVPADATPGLCPASVQHVNMDGGEIGAADWLAGCTGLRSVRIHNSDLTRLADLSALPGLKSLDLGNNRLETLSANTLPAALQRLSLPGNRLQVLPDLAQLPALQELDAADNALHSLFVGSEQSQLTLLSLSGNPLRQLTGLQHLTALHTLRLNRCGLESAPFDWPTSLRRLELDDNAVADLKHIQPAPGVTRLHLNRNPYSRAEALLAWPKLKQVDVHDSGLTALSLDLRNRIKFNLHGEFGLLLMANSLQQARNPDATLLQRLPNTSGQSHGVHKSLQTRIDLNGPLRVSGEVDIESLDGLSRIRLLRVDNTLLYGRDVRVRIQAQLAEGALLVYSPEDEDFLQTAEVLLDTGRLRPLPESVRAAHQSHGFRRHRVTPETPLEATVHLQSMAGDWFLLLASEDGIARDIRLQIEHD